MSRAKRTIGRQPQSQNSWQDLNQSMCSGMYVTPRPCFHTFQTQKRRATYSITRRCHSLCGGEKEL